MTGMKQLKLLMVIFLSLLITFKSTFAAVSGVLAELGAQGKLVMEVQRDLIRLNYLKSKPTGYFGRMTTEALKSFQLEYGLPANGKLDSPTYEALKAELALQRQIIDYTVKPGETLLDLAGRFNASPASIMAQNNLSSNEIVEDQRLLIPVGEDLVRHINSRCKPGGIQAIPWSIVNQLWKNAETVKIIDMETGRSFLAKRYYGYYHADAEPLTKKDTEGLLSIYGGHWNWSRRAVIVQIRSLFIAASVNGMPHGGESIFNNNFPGQFCVHFLGSRVHKDGVVDPIHLRMIERAAAIEWPAQI